MGKFPFTPVLKLTKACGMPVGVLNAGKSLSAICWARSRNIVSPVNAKQDNSPPTNLIFTSNTDTSEFCNLKYTRYNNL